ncbi:MAG TPA: hypothetical protein VFK06_07285 [Candidatus Angelobacter sp.]|nr:hypothetical protein [Candidatus Angelobacter sp.]
MRIGLIAVLLAALPATSPSQSHNRAQMVIPPTFSLVISTKEATIKAGSEVRMEIAITNITDHPIKIAVGPGTYPYLLDVRDADGNLAPETAYGHEMRIEKNGMTLADTLEPGQTEKLECVVSEWNDLTAGTYFIQVQRWRHPNVKSNKLTITVIP